MELPCAAPRSQAFWQLSFVLHWPLEATRRNQSPVAEQDRGYPRSLSDESFRKQIRRFVVVILRVESGERDRGVIRQR